MIRSILRPSLRLMMRQLFGVRTSGDVAAFHPGHLLSVANHESFLDSLLLGPFLPIDPVFVVGVKRRPAGREALINDAGTHSKFKKARKIMAIPRTPHSLMNTLMVAGICASGMIAAQAAPLEVRGALDAGRLGLYSADNFRLADGRCQDCPTIPQALWYFQDEQIATPKTGAAEFARKRQAQDDVRDWATTHPNGGDGTKPSLLWIGSPQLAEGVRLADGGTAMVGTNGQRMPFAVTPKISSNLSYYDASSTRHFSERPLRLRGKTEQGRFIARTIWPEDYALDFSKLTYQPLRAGETLLSMVRADGDKALEPLVARVLWQRDPQAARKWAGKPTLAFMLNGAQGDDDEAHGGHFAVTTGTFGSRGEWGDWLVNNFYNLDSFSEKGIVASTLPMDAYMADLNSGQSWYRPSYMLVVVLKQERTAGLYQEAIGRVYNHFYRHDFLYRHATSNCAGISIETLRSLGWSIPEQGPTSRLKAAVAMPYKAIADKSLDSGFKAFDYLSAEQTELYPFVAFAAAGSDLLQRIATGDASRTTYERMLAEDVEALIYVRIPQFPSSRAVGQAPVASIDEYMNRTPEDKAQWKIVPVPPRPFPESMKDADAPAEAPLPSSLALYAYGGIFGISTLGLWRRRSAKRKSK